MPKIDVPKLIAQIGVPGLVAIGIALFVLYLLPTLIASVRRKPGSLRIVMMNVLLGWTIVFWIVALRRAIAGTATAVERRGPARCANCARLNPATHERCDFCLARMPQAHALSRP